MFERRLKADEKGSFSIEDLQTPHFEFKKAENLRVMDSYEDSIENVNGEM